MTSDQDKRGPGMPRLSEKEDSKPVTFVVPESIKLASDALPRGERSVACRTFLTEYMSLTPEQRAYARDPDVLRAALTEMIRIMNAAYGG